MSYWSDLGTRSQEIRAMLTACGVSLKPGQGLTIALDECDALAAGTAAASSDPETDARVSMRYAHAMWSLHDTLTACRAAGLDICGHLGQLTTGTLDFGVPADTDQKVIFYKDFEAELFVAAQLAKAGLPVTFLSNGDPKGEMTVGGVYVEVKHPNSTKRLDSLVRKFNGQLAPGGEFGVFVVAVEDAFGLAKTAEFPDEAARLAHRAAWRSAVDTQGRAMVHRGSRLPQIAGMATTATLIETVAGVAQMARYGNAIYFDQRTYPPAVTAIVEKILAVFTAQTPPVRFTSIAKDPPESGETARGTQGVQPPPS